MLLVGCGGHLPTELAEAQVEFLEGKFDAARTVVERSGSVLPEGETILQAVENGIDQVHQNRRLYETARDQAPNSETSLDLYEQYLSSIIDLASDLHVLEKQLVYLDLYDYQRASPVDDQLEHTQNISEELKSALDVDVTTIPVVWDGFAIDPLDYRIEATGERNYIYAVILPRTRSDPLRYSPLIGHEFGHAVLDRHEDLETEFYGEILNVRNRTRSESSRNAVSGSEEEGHFVQCWEEWFEELFCDTCGLLAFGPSYLTALVWHLFGSNPYYIERDPNKDMHPPAALRYKLVTELTEKLLPNLCDSVRDYRVEFDSYLEDVERVRPSDYAAYDYDELRQFVLHEVPNRVTHDLDGLVEDIQKGTPPEDSSGRAHRLATNQYWLDSYPP